MIVLLGVVSSSLALALHYFGALTWLEAPLEELVAVSGGGLEYPFLQVLLVFLAGLLMAWWALGLAHPVLFGLVLIVAMVEWVTLKPLLATGGLDYAASPAFLAIWLSAIGGVLLQRLPRQKRHRQLFLALQNRTSPAVREDLLARPPQFDSAVRAAVITYADPEGAWEFPLDLLMDYGGILDGDDPQRVAIIFTGYTAGENPHLTACTALLEACRNLRPRVSEEDLGNPDDAQTPPAAQPHIAIEAGELRARLVPTPPNPQLVFEGNLTSLCWRLNQACALFPARIIAGPKIQQIISDDALFRPVELVRFGINQPVREIYQLIGLREHTQPHEFERVEHFWKGVIFFREGEYTKSHDAFLQAQPLEGHDPLLEDYLRRLNRAQTEEAELQNGARRSRAAFVI